MGSIQSIIVFNGGSAGDFLKAVSIEQLEQKSVHTLTNKGMIDFKNHYFKRITAQWYTNGFQQPIDINNNKVYKVENTHYYHKSYSQVADNIFYIDYPEEMQMLIIELYIKKHWDNDYQKLLQYHTESLKENLKKFVQTENIVKVLNVLWTRNLKTWRKEPTLKKINFQDLLNYDTLKSVVENIIQQPLSSPTRLLISYQKWIAKNQKLVNFFVMPNDSI